MPVILNHYEYFIIIIQDKDKSKFFCRPLSCLDRYDLKTNKKGAKLKTDKKNKDACSINNFTEGVNTIEETKKYIALFDQSYNPEIKKIEDNLDIIQSKIIANNDNLDNFIFIDTSSKKGFFVEDTCTNNQINYLDKIFKSIQKKKKIEKIPVLFFFHTKSVDNSIEFSISNSVFWFRTKKATLSA